MVLLQKLVRQRFNRNMFILFPIVLSYSIGFLLYSYAVEKQKIKTSIERVLQRQSDEISSQIIIYQLYKLSPDPLLLKTIEELHPKLRIGIKGANGDCLVGDCDVFLSHHQFGSYYVEREIKTLNSANGIIGIYLPIASDFFGPFIAILGSLIFGFLSVLFLNTYLNKSFIEVEFRDPLHRLQQLFNLLEAKKYDEISREPVEHYKILEVQTILSKFKDLSDRILKLTEMEKRSHAQKALAELASQVAHDVRSPLAALDNVVASVTALPEDDRLLVRTAVNRIKDIANDLIEKNREFHSTQRSQTQGQMTSAVVTGVVSTAEASLVQLLSSLVEPLITEKRMQFRSKIGIDIDGWLDAASYGLFAKIQPIEFKRVLSNLVNNAVEVLGEKGTVTISLAGKGNEIEIRVTDNGKGIRPEILVKLGQRGETHGKQGGSGLGLYHAMTSVEGWDGTFKIESEVGKGTSIVITLPQAPAPAWFVSELKLVPQSTVVILDDDSSIHGIWQGRFDSLHVAEKGIQIVHFSTPLELIEWVGSSPAAKTSLYLTDHELIGFKETGLTLIESLKLGDQSILVTSRFEEKQIIEDCERLKVRMIPKGMAGFVPISFEQSLEKPDYVLIDNDNLVHILWKSSAKKAGKKILCFKKPEEFLAKASCTHKATPIYVDSDLDDGVQGQVFAKEIFELGFNNIWLCTGFPPERFKAMSWLRGIVPKDPPWGLLRK